MRYSHVYYLDRSSSCFDYCSRKCWRVSGVTLIELMVSISVLAIILSIAVPSFQGIMNSSRASAMSNELASALNFARAEAVKRGTNVTVCKSQNPNAASPTCLTTAAWVNGWLIFVDGSTRGSVDGTDVRLKIGEPASEAGTGITADAVFANYITFLPSGAALGSGTGSSGNFAVCVSGTQRTINVGSVGSIQVSKGTC